MAQKEGKTEAASSLDSLLNPSEVMVVGASTDPSRTGGRLTAMLRRWQFGGRLFLVGSEAAHTSEAGWYPSIEAAGGQAEKIDLAILAMSTKYVMPALKECSAAGVQSAIVMDNANGGESLHQLTQEIKEFARTSSMRILGPNTAGMVVTASNVPASLMRRLYAGPKLENGSVAILTSSGAIANEMLWGLIEQGLKIGAWISTGAQANIVMGEVLEAFARRSEIHEVAVIVESMMDGPAFVKGTDALARAGKSVLIYPALTQSAAESAAKLHSGSGKMAGGVLRAALDWSGAVVFDRFDDMCWSIGWSELVNRHVPAGREPAIAIATISGGAGVAAVDRGIQTGIRYCAELSEQTGQWLSENGVSVLLPIDVGGTKHGVSARNFADICNVIMKDANVDVLWVQASSALFSKHERELIVQILDEAAVLCGVPVLVSCVAPWQENHLAPGKSGMVKVVPSLDAGLAVLRTAAVQRERRARVELRHRSDPLTELKGTLPLVDRLSAALTMVAQWPGFEVPAFWPLELGDGVEEAVKSVLAAIQYPVVVKADSMAHKARMGQVVTNIGSVDKLKGVLAHFRQIGVHHVIVQQQVPAGLELLLGCLVHHDAGPVLVLGRGGTGTDEETVREVLPLPASAMAISHALGLLCQAPGQGLSALGEWQTQLAGACAEFVSRFQGRAPNVAGMEANPVILSQGKVWVVDMRLSGPE